MKKNILIYLFFLLSSCTSAYEKNINLHDAHIHYSQNVWKVISPATAIQLLKNENINRALVSSTPTEGAGMLYKVDPKVVIPMLRPYKSWKHRYLWFNDVNLKSYLLNHLKKIPYKGIGEFHVFGKDAGSVPVHEMIRLARERKLILHAHTDLEGMRIILKKAPDIGVLWAHGGFNVSIGILKKLLEKYRMLYIELSFREGLLDDELKLTSPWKIFLVNYRKRFLIGMDTYTLNRWTRLNELVSVENNWLLQLPADVAADIARNNLDQLFPQE